LDTSTASIKTTSVSLSGEVSANTRKQKIIFFYELDVTIKWEGNLKSDGSLVKGTIQLPYISDENDPDDFEVKLTVEDENNERYKVKEDLRAKIIPILKEKIPEMLDELKQGKSKHKNTSHTNANLKVGASKALLPTNTTKSNTSVPLVDANAILKAPVTEKTEKTEKPSTNTKSGEKTVSFTMKEKFICGVEDLFLCLTDIGRVRAFAGSDAEMSSEKGGKFRLFNGYVTGENIEVERPTKLVQKWRFSTWPEGKDFSSN
jgi:activator of HSP90 ATPase